MRIKVKKSDLPPCPVETTMQLINNKWKIFILRELLAGTKRFNELQRSITNISQKVLTQNLRSMERDGLIVRRIFAEVPPRVEYTLSDLGNSLRPIIGALRDWGMKYKERAAD
ncbi:MAG: helix-turn-helix transcriptional regulator [Planctomycetota bacterium]|nr:helix-turn-helix transcriptional regulator [Planctomycetota bacterium]